MREKTAFAKNEEDDDADFVVAAEVEEAVAVEALANVEEAAVFGLAGEVSTMLFKSAINVSGYSGRMPTS